MSKVLMTSAFAVYLIPTPLGEDDGAVAHTTPEVLAIVRRLNHFWVERAKTARAHLKVWQHPSPMSAINVLEFEGRSAQEWAGLMRACAEQGESIGLMSEAGCPALADPGAKVVAVAHRLGYRVVPLVGPSSVLLALMASGLNGQQFCFHGYAPVPQEEKKARLTADLGAPNLVGATHIYIETPYRTRAFIEQLIAFTPTLIASHQSSSPPRKNPPQNPSATLMLCVAANLTTPQEIIRSRPLRDWKMADAEVFAHAPAIFLLAWV